MKVTTLLPQTAKLNTPFFFVLLLHLVLALAYSSLVPLGEAPDESAHLGYARFIANHGRLPATLAERREADYRADFPPLYYLLIARPLAAVGDAPPTQLKSFGDSPRRLIPFNGQTSAAFIHTADEAWPWQGLTLGWHLSRFVSVLFSTLALIPTYLIARRLTGQRRLAACAAGLQAFTPQVLFVGSVLNEDSLLIFLTGLILLALIGYTTPPRLPGLSHTFVLGLLLGLAGMSKYNALPLCPLVGGWGFWLACQKWRDKTGSLSAKIKRLLQSLSVFSLGVVLTAGWWPAFVWYHFNEVETLGLLRGSLAAFTSSTHDTTLRQVAAGASFSLPSFSDWWAWLVTLFKSFWGLFGGGGAIELPAWAYGSLAVFCLLAVIGLVNKIFRPQPSSFRLPPSSLLLFFLTPLFFLPLPLLRFILTGANVAESAQGRHLFPALPAITLALVWGLSAFHEKFLTGNSGHQGQTPIRNPQYGIGNILARLHLMKIIFPLFSLWLSLYALALIQADFPPPIPLRTTPDAATAKNLLNAPLAKGVTLVGYELHQVEGRFLPLTLVWQAEAIPSQDYLINLTLTGPAGQLLGGWLGHPLGGRYPTRTWDKGDILRDTIPIPLLPHASAAGVTLSLQLLDPQEQPVSVPLTLTPALSLPAQLSSAPVLPPQLRADGLSPASPFTYRSTLSFILPGASDPPILNDPSGQVFTPTRFLSGPGGGIAHFIVAAHWPGGSYQLSLLPGSLFSIHNRPRQFEPPPMAYPLNANFAGAITLLGYDLPQRRVQPGQSFPVTLHLRAERTLGQNLVIFNHLLDQNAGQRGGEDRIPLKYYTTLLWVPGEIVSDAYDVPVETAAPPGVYWLDVGFYPANQPHTSLPLFVEGQPIDRNSVRLGPLKVGGPPPGITVSGINPQQFVKQSFGRQITLIGFNLADLDHHPLDPSQPVPPNLQLALFWQADNIPPADYTVFVHLLNPAGHLVASFDSPPAGGAYPTSLWDPGEIIADQRRLSNLPPGSYTLQAGLYRPDTGERLPTPGSLDGAVSLMDFVVE